MMTPKHLRPDGSYVVTLANGWDYHVTPGDPLFAQAEALDWAGVLPEPVPEAVPAPPPVLTKVMLIDRLTDAELAAADAWLRTAATVRQRRRWDDAVQLDRADPDLVAMMDGLFGAARRAALLA